MKFETEKEQKEGTSDDAKRMSPEVGGGGGTRLWSAQGLNPL